MYKYFVSYNHAETNVATGFGYSVIKSNIKVEKLKTTNDILDWLKGVKDCIEKQNNVQNVVIINFKLME
jgi:hypothetical protein